MIRSLIAILVGAMLADAWLPGVVGFLASLNRAVKLTLPVAPWAALRAGWPSLRWATG